MENKLPRVAKGSCSFVLNLSKELDFSKRDIEFLSRAVKNAEMNEVLCGKEPPFYFLFYGRDEEYTVVDCRHFWGAVEAIIGANKKQ